MTFREMQKQIKGFKCTCKYISKINRSKKSHVILVYGMIKATEINDVEIHEIKYRLEPNKSVLRAFEGYALQVYLNSS